MSKKKHIVPLVYIGRRLNGETSYHVFLEGKQERWFKSARGVAIGLSYAGELRRKTVFLPRRPEWLTDRAPAPSVQAAKWEAEDAAVAVHFERKRARKKVESEARTLMKLAEPLRPVLEHLDYQQTKAVLEFIAGKFRDASRPKRGSWKTLDLSRVLDSLEN